MNSFKKFLAHFFDWNQKEFFTIIAFNIAFGLLFQLFDLYDFIEVITVIALGARSLYFVNHSSLSPSGKSTHSSFSWKYIQSMPISRKSTIMVFSSIKVISVIPLMIWSLSFFPLVIQFFNVGDEVTILGVVRVYLSALILIFIVGMGAINQAVTFPRKQFQDQFSKERTIKYIRIFSLVVVGSIYFGIAGYLLEEHYGVNIFVIFKYASELFEFIFKSWILPLLMVGLAFTSYKRTLSVWNKEASSYFKEVKINHKKEFSIIAVCMLLVGIPMVSVDMVTPTVYRGHEILKFAYRNDYVGIQKYLSNTEAMGFKNSHGYSAYLVAAAEGGLETLKLLDEALPIDYSATAEFGKDKLWLNALGLAIHRQNHAVAQYLIERAPIQTYAIEEQKITPLHLAVVRCHPLTIELLIQKGVDVNAKEYKGKTPLHYAAKNNCFAGIFLLKEAGAKLDSLDYKGRTPLDRSIKNENSSSFSHHYLKRITSKKISN